MTQTGDLIKKMSDFFTSEEFSEKGEDARLELSPDDVRCMCYIIRQRLYMSLEQEPILDKIRAEIENDWQLKKYPSSPFSCGLRRALEIIDKYKAESEDKE